MASDEASWELLASSRAGPSEGDVVSSMTPTPCSPPDRVSYTSSGGCWHARAIPSRGGLYPSWRPARPHGPDYSPVGCLARVTC